MRLILQPHPDWPAKAVTGIAVEARRSAEGGLEVAYFLTGLIDNLVIPPLAPSTRADGLWQHTCFEAFVRASGDATYHEFNFAPSTQWAAYRFDTYREGMRPIDLPALAIASSATPQEYELRASVAGLPGLAGIPIWQLGLSAVIEEADGTKSYWALAHPPGKADFHHEDCFAHILNAPEPA